jgi:hypothetical protein
VVLAVLILELLVFKAPILYFLLSPQLVAVTVVAVPQMIPPITGAMGVLVAVAVAITPLEPEVQEL